LKVSKLKKKNFLKLIYENEMLAILHTVYKWHPYQIGRHFKEKIDHDSLKYFLEQQLYLEEKQKWITKMLDYEFELCRKRKRKCGGRCTFKETRGHIRFNVCYFHYKS
jgi:hypothetical protein